MLCNDRFVGDERFALAKVIHRRHAEFVLFSLVEAGDVEARRPTEPAHWRPDSTLLVLLLDNIVTHRLAAVVLQVQHHNIAIRRQRTPHWSPRASSDTVSCTFTYHTWQFIIFTIFTITACIFSYSLSISFWTQDLAFQQIFSSIDLFLSYLTDFTDSRTIPNSRLGSSSNPFLHRPFSFLPDWFHGLTDHPMILLCSTAGFVCMVC